MNKAFFDFNTKSFHTIIYDFIKQKEYSCIEIEARVGKIISKITNKRLNYLIEHPITFEELPSELFFESGVEEKDFKLIKEFICGLENLISKFDKVTICDKIRKIEEISNGKEDLNVVFQKKTKIKSLDIFLPKFQYDVRVSISLESEVSPNEFKIKSGQICRHRERESLEIGPFVFDFTKVSKLNEKSIKNNKNYEIELEIKDFKDGLVDFSKIVYNLPVLKKNN